MSRGALACLYVPGVDVLSINIFPVTQTQISRGVLEDISPPESDYSQGFNRSFGHWQEQFHDPGDNLTLLPYRAPERTLVRTISSPL